MMALLVIAVTNIAMNIILIPRYSYMGTAYTSLITEFLVVIVTGLLVYKHIGYIPSFEHAGRIMFSGTLMAIAFLVLPQDSFFITGLLASTVYIVSLAAVRAVNLKEVRSVFVSSEPVTR
jgi:O-antigen/teichoic acid export membrane protein